MDENVTITNPELRISIEKTKATLGPYVKYPRLEVKYLQKPPFLFIHDIVTYVIRNHGFLNDLFSADELNRNIVKTSKQKRADFLKKLVVALRTVSGDRIPDCNWNKLASGKFPFLTNTILRSIANALTMKMSCGLAVKKITGGLVQVIGSGQQNQKRKFGTENFGHDSEKMEIALTLTPTPSETDATKTRFDDPRKRSRQLTLWDIDVNENEFIENFDAINEQIEMEYEKDYSNSNSSSEENLEICGIISVGVISQDPEQQWMSLEYEFQSMELSS